MEPFSYQGFYRQFEPQLQRVIDEQIVRILLLSQSTYLNASQVQMKKLAAKGKRFRAYLVALAYHTAGAQVWRQTFSPGIALELVHLFALIHDDIIDANSERRGVATLERFSADWFEKNRQQGDQKQFGRSMAILWGDLIVAAAFRNAQSAWLSVELSQLLEELIVGQFLDVELRDKQTKDQVELDRKNYLKTSQYSFVRPLLIGGKLADASPLMLKQFSEIGHNLGSAFQLQDDLEDGETGLPTSSQEQLQQNLQAAMLTINRLPKQSQPGWQDLLKLLFPNQTAVG